MKPKTQQVSHVLKITQSSPLSMTSAVVVSGSRNPCICRSRGVPCMKIGFSVLMSVVAQPIFSGAA